MIRFATALSALLLLSACTGEAGASGSPAGIVDQLTKTLSAVTDTATAEKAKSEITSLTDQLSTALESTKAVAKGAGDAGGSLGKMAGDLAGKWLTPELKTAFASVTTEVERLLANPDTKNVLGSALEKLKGLIPSAG